MAERDEESVRAASRILAVLQAMNREPHSTLHSLHGATGLPKSTLVRLLKTLTADGYVSNDPRHAGYQITSLVTSLSSGFHGDPLVVEAGRAWAIGLSTEFKWRLSLFTRALGRAYLAGCGDEQIDAFIAREGTELESPEARERDKVWRMVRTTRDRGFAMRDPHVEPRTSDTIAVPIFARGVVQASIGITYFRAATNAFGTRDELVAALKRAAAGIGAEVDRLTAHRS